MSEILAWWNLIFLLPLAFAALFLLMNAIGIAGSDSDIGGDAAMDHDLEADHDLATDHDLAADHDMDHHLETDHDADDSDSSGQSSSRIFLEFLGAGRIPLTLILQIFLLTWGISGWILNVILQRIIPEPWIYVWISIAGAFLCSALMTRITARTLQKYAPLSETYAKVHEELIGCEGESVYQITSDAGMAQVYDDRGTLHRIYCRIEPHGIIIANGEKILITGYDKEQGLYYVRQSPLQAPHQKQELPN